MRKRAAPARIVSLLLGGVLAAGLAGRASDQVDFGLFPEPRPPDAERAASLAKLAAEAERIRGLRLGSHPRWNLRTRPEMYQLLVRQIQAESDPRRNALAVRLGAAFGFWPPEFDRPRALFDMQYNMIGGSSYSSSDREFTDVLESGAESPDRDRQIENDARIVHEYIHALQDQALDLPALGLADGNDRAQAIRALAEGDAVLATCIYKAGRKEGPAAEARPGLVAAEVASFRSQMAGIPESELFKKYPPAFGQSLVFSYDAGTGFVAAVFKQGGWAAVNRCYQAPPVSTAQILHPEKYLRPVPEDPVEVRLPEIPRAALPTLELIDADTLGEFETGVLLEAFVPREAARRAAAGWNGDLYAAFERTKGARKGELVLVWLSVWDTEADAREFFAAYAQALDKKCGAARQPPDAGSLIIDWCGGRRAARLELRGKAVLSVEGAEEAETGRLGQVFWTAERRAPAPRRR